jgi:hypothetical protein
MAGTIYSDTYVNGIVLSNPTTQQPATVTGTVSKSYGYAVLGRGPTGWTIGNEGTIADTGAAGFGVNFAAGGTVNNGESGAAAALITGAGGVLIRGEAGTVSNLATITGTGSKGNAVELDAGGEVGNGGPGATAASIDGGQHAVAIRGAVGEVSNFGTLEVSGTYAVVALLAGGGVTNGSSTSSSTLIEGSGRGVYIDNAPGTVVNYGTIQSGRGIVLGMGGTVVNRLGGVISAAAGEGVSIAAAGGAVTNSGNIDGGDGVILRTGGTIANLPGGLVTGSNGNGAKIGGTPGTVTNLGTVSGSRSGLYLADGGNVANGSATASSSLLSGGAGHEGVCIAGNTGIVTNYGIIEGGYGVVLRAGGTVINQLGGVISATARDGVAIAAAGGTVTNYGTISGVSYGVVLRAGGTVTNFASGRITGVVAIEAAPGTVTNLGTVAGGASGLYLADGGEVTNGSMVATSAVISARGGHHAGIVIAGTVGTVANFGSIAGGYGVLLRAGGAVVNELGGMISATAGDGVKIGGAAGTVTNFGTITTSAGGIRYVGVYLYAGTVINGSTTASALIGGRGVYIYRNTGTVINYGTILGRGVNLHRGGAVANKPGGVISGIQTGARFDSLGTVTNFGTVFGEVSLRNGGTLVNGGTGATGAYISGGVSIPEYGGTGTLSNFGTIKGNVRFTPPNDQSCFVTNGSAESTGASIIGGVIIEGYQVKYYNYRYGYRNGYGTITNFGTIDGVSLVSGALFNGSTSSRTAYIGGFGVTASSVDISNFGTIRGVHQGILLSTGRVLNNFGAITGGDQGILLDTYGYNVLTNFGTIQGHYGIVLKNSGRPNGARYYLSLDNNGTIAGMEAGGAAVDLKAPGIVVVEPRAVFVGAVEGGGGSKIEFATPGPADMSDVFGFDTITLDNLDNGQSHTLTLTSANFATVVGSAITVDDQNSRDDTVTAATLPAADRIIVHAGAGLDTLTGGAGDDVFFSGGDTTMTGGAGQNEFVFSAPGGNTVADLAVSAANEVVFSNSGFGFGLSGASKTPAALPAALFVENGDGHFTNANQRFVYATGTGDLFFSASGSSGTPALVSHFTGTPLLAASQLFFIT